MENEMIKKVLAECKINFSENRDAVMEFTSVQHVLLVAALEEELDIKIPDEYLDPGAINTFSKIENMVKVAQNVRQ